MGATKGRIWIASPDPSRFARLLTVPLPPTALLPAPNAKFGPPGPSDGHALPGNMLRDFLGGRGRARARAMDGGLKGSLAAISCRRGGLLPSQRHSVDRTVRPSLLLPLLSLCACF